MYNTETLGRRELKTIRRTNNDLFIVLEGGLPGRDDIITHVVLWGLKRG